MESHSPGTKDFVQPCQSGKKIRWPRSSSDLQPAKVRETPIPRKPDDQIFLEHVLGMTVTSNSALTSDPRSGLVAYPAGCVLVLLDSVKNKQVGTLYTPRKSITASSFSSDGRYLLTGECGLKPAVRVWDIALMSEVAALRGHSFGIKTAVFSPRMREIIVVGDAKDMMISVWTWPGKVMTNLNKFSDDIFAMDVASDSQYFVTVGNKHVKFCYLDTKHWTRPIPPNPSCVDRTYPVPLTCRYGMLDNLKENCFCDVACGRGDNSYVFVITTSGILCQLNSHRFLERWVNVNMARAVSLATDGSYVIVGGCQGLVRMFNAHTLKIVLTLPRPHCLGLDIAQPQQAPTYQNTPTAWPPIDHQQQHPLENIPKVKDTDPTKPANDGSGSQGHTDYTDDCDDDDGGLQSLKAKSHQHPGAKALTYDPIHDNLTVVYDDNSLYIWTRQTKTAADVEDDVLNFHKRYSSMYHRGSVWDLTLYPVASQHERNVDADGDSLEDNDAGGALPPGALLSVSGDGTLRAWDVSADICQESLLQRNSVSPQCLKIVYAERVTETTCARKTPDILVRRGSKLQDGFQHGISALRHRKQGFTVVSVCPDGEQIATGNRHGRVCIYGTHTMGVMATMHAHEAEVTALSYSISDNYKILASGSRDRMIHVMDASRGYQLLTTLDDHSSTITAINFTYISHYMIMATSSLDMSVLVRVYMGSEAFILNPVRAIVEKKSITDFAIHPWSGSLAFACQDRHLRVYNIMTSTDHHSFLGCPSHGGHLVKVKFDPSGQYLLTACSMKTINLLQYTTGQLISTFNGHAEIITSIQFSHNVKHVISAAVDGCIFLWRLPQNVTYLVKRAMAEMGRLTKGMVFKRSWKKSGYENKQQGTTDATKCIFQKQNQHIKDEQHSLMIEQQTKSLSHIAGDTPKHFGYDDAKVGGDEVLENSQAESNHTDQHYPQQNEVVGQQHRRYQEQQPYPQQRRLQHHDSRDEAGKMTRMRNEDPVDGDDFEEHCGRLQHCTRRDYRHVRYTDVGEEDDGEIERYHENEQEYKERITTQTQCSVAQAGWQKEDNSNYIDGQNTNTDTGGILHKTGDGEESVRETNFPDINGTQSHEYADNPAHQETSGGPDAWLSACCERRRIFKLEARSIKKILGMMRLVTDAMEKDLANADSLVPFTNNCSSGATASSIGSTMYDKPLPIHFTTETHGATLSTKTLDHFHEGAKQNCADEAPDDKRINGEAHTDTTRHRYSRQSNAQSEVDVDLYPRSFGTLYGTECIHNYEAGLNFVGEPGGKEDKDLEAGVFQSHHCLTDVTDQKEERLFTAYEFNETDERHTIAEGIKPACVRHKQDMAVALAGLQANGCLEKFVSKKVSSKNEGWKYHEIKNTGLHNDLQPVISPAFHGWVRSRPLKTDNPEDSHSGGRMQDLEELLREACFRGRCHGHADSISPNKTTEPNLAKGKVNQSGNGNLRGSFTERVRTFSNGDMACHGLDINKTMSNTNINHLNGGSGLYYEKESANFTGLNLTASNGYCNYRLMSDEFARNSARRSVSDTGLLYRLEPPGNLTLSVYSNAMMYQEKESLGDEPYMDDWSEHRFSETFKIKGKNIEENEEEDRDVDSNNRQGGFFHETNSFENEKLRLVDHHNKFNDVVKSEDNKQCQDSSYISMDGMKDGRLATVDNNCRGGDVEARKTLDNVNDDIFLYEGDKELIRSNTKDKRGGENEEAEERGAEDAVAKHSARFYSQSKSQLLRDINTANESCVSQPSIKSMGAAGYDNKLENLSPNKAIQCEYQQQCFCSSLKGVTTSTRLHDVCLHISSSYSDSFLVLHTTGEPSRECLNQDNANWDNCLQGEAVLNESVQKSENLCDVRQSRAEENLSRPSSPEKKITDREIVSVRLDLKRENDIETNKRLGLSECVRIGNEVLFETSRDTGLAVNANHEHCIDVNNVELSPIKDISRDAVCHLKNSSPHTTSDYRTNETQMGKTDYRCTSTGDSHCNTVDDIENNKPKVHLNKHLGHARSEGTNKCFKEETDVEAVPLNSSDETKLKGPQIDNNRIHGILKKTENVNIFEGFKDINQEGVDQSGLETLTELARFVFQCGNKSLSFNDKIEDKSENIANGLEPSLEFYQTKTAENVLDKNKLDSNLVNKTVKQTFNNVRLDFPACMSTQKTPSQENETTDVPCTTKCYVGGEKEQPLINGSKAEGESLKGRECSMLRPQSGIGKSHASNQIKDCIRHHIKVYTTNGDVTDTCDEDEDGIIK